MIGRIETPYRRLLAQAIIKFGADEARLERIFIKKLKREEIRVSWWKNGKFQLRPLDISQEMFLQLLGLGVTNGVFQLSEHMLKKRGRS